jgi:hypothetical protein
MPTAFLSGEALEIRNSTPPPLDSICLNGGQSFWAHYWLVSRRRRKPAILYEVREVGYIEMKDAQLQPSDGHYEISLRPALALRTLTLPSPHRFVWGENTIAAKVRCTHDYPCLGDHHTSVSFVDFIRLSDGHRERGLGTYLMSRAIAWLKDYYPGNASVEHLTDGFRDENERNRIVRLRMFARHGFIPNPHGDLFAPSLAALKVSPTPTGLRILSDSAAVSLAARIEYLRRHAQRNARRDERSLWSRWISRLKR